MRFPPPQSGDECDPGLGAGYLTLWTLWKTGLREILRNSLYKSASLREKGHKSSRSSIRHNHQQSS